MDRCGALVRRASNRKWFRNLVIASVLIEALEGLELRYPDPPPGLDSITIE